MSYKICDLSQPMGYMGPVWPHVVISGSPEIMPDSALLRAESTTWDYTKGQLGE